jgi:hypothetical protein
MKTSPPTQLASTPLQDQKLVKTAFGRGLVVRLRPCGTQEVRLLEVDESTKEERVASEQFGGRDSDIMYTSDKLDSVDPVVGDDVICSVGRGRVTKIVSVKIVKKGKENAVAGAGQAGADGNKDDDGEQTRRPNEQPKQVRELLKYEVELTSWRLAGRSKVKCYMYKSALQVVRKKMLSEMNAQERVEFAQRQKISAVKVFKDKQYQHALNLYAGAVDSVRFVQHDANSSNETRARLIEVMVTCSNNAATCCAQLCRWPEAAKFAQNALILLDALIDKKGLNIHTILTSDEKDGGCGLCDAKLFGEWRVKSYIMIARSLAEKKDYSGAIEILRRARNIIVEYSAVVDGGENKGSIEPPSDVATCIPDTDAATKASIARLRVQDKELRRLMTSCMEHKKAEKKKEKQRAQAMFGSPSSTGEEKKENTTPPNSPSLHGGVGVSRNGEEDGGDKFETPLSTPTKEIRPKYVRMGDDVHKISDSSARIMPRQSSLKKNRPPASIDRRVSFSEEVEERQINDLLGSVCDDEEEEESFLEQNKEALILVGVAGLAALSVFALRGSRR